MYTAIYFLLPRYILREKYFSFFLVTIGLTIIYFSLAWLLTLLLVDLTTHIPLHQLPVSVIWFQPIRYGIGLPLTSAVFTIIIKMLKSWHQEQQENELLQRQKIDTELQFLRSQFQPHFLYDALQHIFYLISKNSPQSPATVLKLSDLLSYVLYDNEKENVSLEKELQIIKTYLSLKKIFYPERLNVEIKQEGNTAGLSIAPVILLSIVESYLERFLLMPTSHLHINLDIKTENGGLYFLMDGKCTVINEQAESDDNNKWIRSLKRIEMLYPGKHNMDVYAENGVTNLLLVLELGETSTFAEKEKLVLS